MADQSTRVEESLSKPAEIRLWFPAALVVLYWAFQWIVPHVEMTSLPRFLSRIAMYALVPLAFLIWWWANRRIPLADRAYGFGLVVAGGVIASLFSHPTMGTFGLVLYGLPLVVSVWTLWLFVARRVSHRGWRIGLSVAIALGWGYMTLLRMEGLSGNQVTVTHWRWQPSPEELFLAERSGTAHSGSDQPLPAPDRPADAAGVILTEYAETPPVTDDSAGFRGSHRDGVVRDIRISTDWSNHPPQVVWRQRVGPGWSAVSIAGERVLTQEQRGEEEVVVCLDANTGREIWVHRDSGRFVEAVSGAGPRGTPTIAAGRVLTLGARGILNCLDLVTGDRLWSHDVVADSGASVPQWGFTNSPLVISGVVIVYSGGEGAKDLLAYRVDTGELAWTAPAGKSSYASVQPATLCGIRQALLLADHGLTSVDPGTGRQLWEFPLGAPGSPRTVQPHVVGDSQVVIASETDFGVALLDVTFKEARWSVKKRWESKDLKPQFNDFVVHREQLYGFDSNLFCCVDLKTGKRAWKGGRYGHGQVVLLAEQSLLLVLSEAGEAVLLATNPSRLEELGRFQAIEGKTWNHPVVVPGRLYVRNAQEMACYELPSQ